MARASDPDGAQSAGTSKDALVSVEEEIESEKMLKPRKTKVSHAIQEL